MPVRRVNLVIYSPGLSDARCVDSVLVTLPCETPARRVVLFATDLGMLIWKLGFGSLPIPKKTCHPWPESLLAHCFTFTLALPTALQQMALIGDICTWGTVP